MTREQIYYHLLEQKETEAHSAFADLPVYDDGTNSRNEYHWSNPDSEEREVIDLTNEL